MGIVTQTQEGLKFIDSNFEIVHLDGTTSTTMLTVSKPAAGANSFDFNGEAYFKNANSRYLIFHYEDSVNTIASAAAAGTGSSIESLNIRGDNVRFYTAYDSNNVRGTLTLTLDNSNNATFAGKVGIGSAPSTRGLEVSGAGALGTILASDGTVNTVLWGDASGSNHGGVGTDNNYGFNIYQNGGVAIEIDTSKNAAFAGDIIASGGAVHILSNQITSGWNADSEDSDIWINYRGYAGGTTRFRDFRVGDGKGNQILLIDGSAGSATFAGQVIASSSSSGDYVRMYGGSGTAQWDIYGNGENLRFSENSGGGGHVDIDTNLIVDGNVGINITVPTAKIDVREDANNVYTGYFYNSNTGSTAHGINVQTASTNADAYAFRVNSASNSNALVVKGNANVGIGTDDPGAPLQVNAAIYSQIRLHSDHTYSVNRNWRFITNNFGNGNWGGFSIESSSSQGGTSYTPKFGIDVSGNVGIGINTSNTAVSAKLHVAGNSILANNTTIDPDSVANTVVAGAVADGSGWGLTAAIGGNAGTGHSWGLGSNGSAFYMGYQNGSAVNTLQSFLIAYTNRHLQLVPTSGNVVIGNITATPDRKLHVTGDDSDGIKISGGTNGRFVELSSSNLNYYTTSSGGYAMGQRILKNSDSSVLGAVSGAYGTGSALTYMYYGGTAYNDAAMYILPNKNIGIGTNAPARDLHLKKSNSGGQVRAEVFNTSNTANSHGIVSIYSGGASAGDPFLHWKVEGIQDWSMGIDNSDSDKLKISKNFGPGTNDYLSIDTSGNATFAGNITAGNSSTDVTIRAHHDDGAYVDHTGYGIQFARNASYLRPDADGTRTMYFGGSSHTWNAINFDSNSYSFQRNGSEYMQINSSGNISVAPGYNGGVFAADGSGNVDTNWGLKIQKTTNVDDYNVRLQFYPDGASATAARKLGFYDERNNAWLGYWDGSVNSNLNWIFNSGGNVGIGVTTPDTKLRIDSSDNNQLKLNRTGVGAFKLFVESGGGFVFEDDGTERLRLDSSGNVGIGTTSPSQKLEVIGTTRITGDLQLDQQNPRIDFDNGVASGSLRFFSTARSATIVNINPAGALSVTSDGSRADGSTLLLKHANNNTTDTIGTIFFGNNADETLSKIVAETSGANNTSNLLFGTSNAGTMATVLTLNADNSATFAGNVDATNFRDKDNTSYSLTPNSGSQGQWRVNTPSGYVDIGPANASYSHFSTDRGRFYFNKKLVVNEGIIGSYDEDLKLRRADADNDYILIRDTSIGFFLDTAEDMRLENDGDLHVEGDVIAYSTTISDNRLKDDVVTIDSALDKVSKLRGVEYTWNATSRKGQKDIGVIAQEVEEVIPEIVREKEMALIDGGKYKTVDYEKLTAVLIEAVKELKEEVEELKNKCNDCTC